MSELDTLKKELKRALKGKNFKHARTAIEQYQKQSGQKLSIVEPNVPGVHTIFYLLVQLGAKEVTIHCELHTLLFSHWWTVDS